MFCEDIADGETYYFRSVAIDNAGNEEAKPATEDAWVKIDNSPPVCSIDPLPEYINRNDYFGTENGIPVTWSVNDAYSGVSSVVISYRNFCSEGDCGGSSCDINTWKPVDVTSEGSSSTKRFGEGYENCTFRFFCNATDNVANYNES
jgi:hypothetical protein